MLRLFRPIAFLLILAPSAGVSSAGVLDRVADDLENGRDIVITSYVGLWYTNNDSPKDNLYWGQLYGHETLFRKAKKAQRDLAGLTAPGNRRADHCGLSRVPEYVAGSP
jgi:hypothetical protein